MVMQTVDHNWIKLKNEDRTLAEPKVLVVKDPTDIKLIQWNNNPTQQKLTWRESMVPNTLWIDKGDHKGMWRSIENRLVEEIQAELRTQHGYRVLRSTARDHQGISMLNVKLIEIQQDQKTQEVILIVNGKRIYVGKQGKISGGVSWKFTDSIEITDLVKV
jgi:hypothetical protein